MARSYNWCSHCVGFIPMRLIDFPIPQDLQAWIERISLLELGAGEVMPVFAGARVHLGFVLSGSVSFGVPQQFWQAEEAVCWGAVAGGSAVEAGPQGARGALLKLAGGVAPAVLGCSAEACAGQVLALQAFWPHWRPAPVQDFSGQLEHVWSQLRQAISCRAAAAWSPRLCAQAMASFDVLPVEGVADSLGVSRATLERQIRRNFGLTPKQLSRIQRFYRALAALNRLDAAALAVEAGYYDQSHMIAEFNELAGQTPARLLQMAANDADLLRLYGANAVAVGRHSGR